MISLYARIAAAIAVLVLLAGIGWRIDQGGYKRATAQWNAEKLATSENARLREQAAQKSTERIDRDLQTAKDRLAIDSRANSDKLRELQAALNADTNASTTSSLDDPRDTIIDSCAAALVGMDEYAKGVALKAIGLQGYTREVCLK